MQEDVLSATDSMNVDDTDSTDASSIQQEYFHQTVEVTKQTTTTTTTTTSVAPIYPVPIISPFSTTHVNNTVNNNTIVDDNNNLQHEEIELQEISHPKPETQTTSTKTPFSPAVNQEHDNFVPQEIIPPRKRNLFERFLLFLWIRFQALVFEYWHYFLFNAREMRRRKCSFLLGSVSIFIVVFAIALAGSIIQQTGLVMLRLGENESGEYDVQIQANQYSMGVSLNYSQVIQNLQKAVGSQVYQQKYSLSAPRLKFSANVHADRYCLLDPTDSSSTFPDVYSLPLDQQRTFLYQGILGGTKVISNTTNCATRNSNGYCVDYFCNFRAKVDTFVYHDELEKKMGFGRAFNYPPLLENEVYVTKTYADSYGLQVNSTLFVSFTMRDFLLGPLRQSNIVNDTTVNTFPSNVILVVKVKDILPASFGKFSLSVGFGMLFNYNSFFSLISNYISAVNLTEYQRVEFSTVNPMHYASQVYFNMPNRGSSYNQNDYDTMQRTVTGFMSEIFYFIGFDQIESSMPILSYLRGMRYFSLFAGLIVNVIVTVLTILAIILVYSLLMINVENRVFEFGVLRMIGIKKVGLIQLILMQSFFFSIPAYISALIIAQILYLIFSTVLAELLLLDVSRVLDWLSVLIATGLGILIPIVASILPIRAALGQNLHDSLDTSRGKTKAVKIKIERNSESSISYSQLIIGGALAIFGGLIYFVFPLALLSLNLTVLLYMFFALLLGMLLGMVVLSLNLQGFLERILATVLFFWENSAQKSMIVKNLVAHRERNRKTTIMFALSLGFIMFVSISFTVQIIGLRYDTLKDYGVRLNIRTSGRDLNNKLLITDLMAIINDPKHEGLITDVAYASYAMHEVTGWNTYAMNMGKYASGRQWVYAASPNFFQVIGTEFFIPTEGPYSGLPLDSFLYSAEGSKRIAIGETYRSYFGISTGLNTPIALEFSYNTDEYPYYEYHVMKPAALVQAAAFFDYSNFPDVTEQDAVVSFPTFLRLSGGSFEKVEDVPIYIYFLKTAASIDEDRLTALKRDIQRRLTGTNAWLRDVEDQLSTLNLIIRVMDFFFIFTTVIAMIMCFFSLNSSMYTNIYEQTKEIGILRAVGSSKFFIIRLYIYEAFLVVVTASIIGICIGSIVGYTMNLQRVLFTQTPIPQGEVILKCLPVVATIIVLAFIFAFLSAIAPTIALVKLPIVTILRKVVT